METMTDYVVERKVKGNQRVRLLDEDTAFAITAVKDKPHHYETHLKRLLAHTPITELEWVNMVNNDANFTTLS